LATSHAIAVRNNLLGSLPPHALAALLPKLTAVELSTPKVVYEPDTVIEAIYFPVSGMISLVAVMQNGDRAEVGIIGREGMLGMPQISGVDTSYVEAMVQMSCTLLRMTASDFRHEMDVNRPLRAVMYRYSEAMQSQIMQTAACNKRHPLEQRLVRWLLMAHDRAEHDEVPLTQEFLSMMLGVLRPTISIAAAALQRQKLIEYAAGHITVLDRVGLEKVSCECYAVFQRRFVALLGKTDAPRRRASLVHTSGNGMTREPRRIKAGPSSAGS
jgi:CRP-like cAMP-binding protein